MKQITKWSTGIQDSEAKTRILIVYRRNIGDYLLQNLIIKLRERYPDPEITLLSTPDGIASISVDLGITDTISVSTRSRRNPQEALHIAKCMRQHNFDLAILPYDDFVQMGKLSFEEFILAYASGAKEIRTLNHHGEWNEVSIVSPLRVWFEKTFRKGWQHRLLCNLSIKLRRDYVWGKPTFLTIENTNVCHLKCPVCETGAGILGRKGQMMPLERYKQIIDELAPHTNYLLFYYMGEPFLHKQAYEMIRYAKEKDIYTFSSTTGEYIDPKQLVESGIDEIYFAVGGATQDTHEIYRVRGRLDRTVNNLREVIRERERQGRRLPIVTLGMITMKHNVHEIPAFFDLARDIGVDKAHIISSTVRTIDQARLYLTDDERYHYFDKQALDEGVLKFQSDIAGGNKCDWIFHSTVICADGRVIPCCTDVHAHFTMGNIFGEDFSGIWNGPRYREFRKRILNKQREISICNKCLGYDPVGSLYPSGKKLTNG